MKEPKISVIVPVYNTEKWLRRCVNSILSQTFADFELLLVDDGSTDASGAICDEYTNQDSRVRVFHKPNGGVSSARNLGLDNARGEWITFCDADDWIDPDYYNIIMSTDFSFKPDIIITGFRLQHKDGKDIYKYHPWGDNKIKNIQRLLISMGGTCVWGKFFKNDLVQKHKIQFPEGIRYCEDFKFCASAYIYSGNIFYVKDCSGYNYFERDSSVCHNIDDTHIMEAVAMNVKIIELAKKENLYTQYIKPVCWRILSCTQDWVMFPSKHALLKTTFTLKKKYILSCPLFWNIRQKLCIYLVHNNLAFIVRAYLFLREKKTILSLGK